MKRLNFDYASVYRKIQAVKLNVLAKASNAVEECGDEWQEAVWHIPNES